MIKGIRRAIKLSGRIGLILSIMSSLPVIRRMLNFDYLFFTYAGSIGDRKAYGPKWLQNLFPAIVPVGLLNRGDEIGYGLLLGTAKPLSVFEAPEKIEYMMKTVNYWHQKFSTRSIALGGQIPSVLHRKNIAIRPPLLAGQYGTVYILHLLIKALTDRFDMNHRRTVIGVLGVGFIGSALVYFLADSFDRVVAVDTRKLEPADKLPENVVCSDNSERLGICDLVVILTGSGDEAASAIPRLKSGVIVIDDAHPQLSPRFAELIRDHKGGQVYKAAVGLKDVRFIPRLPGFEPDWIPGCAIEAIVSARFGFEYHSQAEFNVMADQMGFYPLFVSHKKEH